MKFLFVMLAITAGIHALPKDEVKQNPVPVFQAVDKLLQDLFQTLVEKNDPYQEKQFNYAGQLIKTQTGFEVYVDVSASDVLITGLSNFVTNKFTVGIFGLNLRLDLFFPQLDLSVGQSNARVNVVGLDIYTSGSGKVNVKDARLTVSVDIGFGMGGLIVEKTLVEVTVGEVSSDAELNIFGRDVSASFNSILEGLPQILETPRNLIARFLSTKLKRGLDRIISNT